MQGRRFAGLGALMVGVALLVSASPVGAGGSAAISSPEVDCSVGTSCVVSWTGANDVEVFAGTDVDDIDTTTPVATSDGETTVTVEGLDPTARYYFELVPDGAKRGTIVADRSLHLESAPNARDIGGYETKGGRHVKWGTVYRSDAISEASDADLAKLENLGIKIVCDFRGPSEVEADGPDKLPAGAELVEVPIFDADNDLSDKIRTAIVSGDAAAQEALLGDGKAEQVLIDAGRTFVEDASAREQFAAVMERIADGESLPAFTHCTAGKDRTGWSTAVVLSALGVPKETIIEDYLLTNEFAADKNAERIQQVQGLMENPDLLLPVLEVRKEYIQSSFDAVERKYGSMANYLKKGLGLTAADIKALREQLLTD